MQPEVFKLNNCFLHSLFCSGWKLGAMAIMEPVLCFLWRRRADPGAPVQQPSPIKSWPSLPWGLLPGIQVQHPGMSWWVFPACTQWQCGESLWRSWFHWCYLSSWPVDWVIQFFGLKSALRLKLSSLSPKIPSSTYHMGLYFASPPFPAQVVLHVPRAASLAISITWNLGLLSWMPQ